MMSTQTELPPLQSRPTVQCASAPVLKRIAFGCLAFGGFIGSLLPISVLAASGTFTYVAGQVFVERNGQRIVAARGVEVDPGDLIVAGADGMAQLSMIDQAKLSLRSNSQLRIERYQRKAGDQDGAVLSLLRGTLRTFTGLLTASNRDKYQMKTRVATVGIRGSGNILAHEEEEGKPPVTINHTIEGSHIISSLTGNFAPIITLPNDTVKVEDRKS
ncbi:MAG: FecR domain-containing protein, partial [Rhodocyclaceae bacterium]|nr:FecR domain-containing protein [Rhodocyclaceae bacterium]